MSNHKLYTKEQLVETAKSAFEAGTKGKSFLLNIDSLTPLEIPSDEEIWDEGDKEDNNGKHYAFTRGAKYVINKIQGGNNEV